MGNELVKKGEERKLEKGWGGVGWFLALGLCEMGFCVCFQIDSEKGGAGTDTGNEEWVGG